MAAAAPLPSSSSSSSSSSSPDSYRRQRIKDNLICDAEGKLMQADLAHQNTDIVKWTTVLLKFYDQTDNTLDVMKRMDVLKRRAAAQFKLGKAVEPLLDLQAAQSLMPREMPGWCGDVAPETDDKAGSETKATKPADDVKSPVVDKKKKSKRKRAKRRPAPSDTTTTTIVPPTPASAALPVAISVDSPLPVLPRPAAVVPPAACISAPVPGPASKKKVASTAAVAEIEPMAVSRSTKRHSLHMPGWAEALANDSGDDLSSSCQDSKQESLPLESKWIAVGPVRKHRVAKVSHSTPRPARAPPQAPRLSRTNANVSPTKTSIRTAAPARSVVRSVWKPSVPVASTRTAPIPAASEFPPLMKPTSSVTIDATAVVPVDPVVCAPMVTPTAAAEPVTVDVAPIVPMMIVAPAEPAVPAVPAVPVVPVAFVAPLAPTAPIAPVMVAVEAVLPSVPVAPVATPIVAVESVLPSVPSLVHAPVAPSDEGSSEYDEYTDYESQPTITDQPQAYYDPSAAGSAYYPYTAWNASAAAYHAQLQLQFNWLAWQAHCAMSMVPTPTAATASPEPVVPVVPKPSDQDHENKLPSSPLADYLEKIGASDAAPFLKDLDLEELTTLVDATSLMKLGVSRLLTRRILAHIPGSPKPSRVLGSKFQSARNLEEYLTLAKVSKSDPKALSALLSHGVVLADLPLLEAGDLESFGVEDALTLLRIRNNLSL